MQNGSSVRIHTRCTHVFARFGADSHAQSVLVNKNFCIGARSEVYQECTVGWVAIFGIVKVCCMYCATHTECQMLISVASCRKRGRRNGDCGAVHGRPIPTARRERGGGRQKKKKNKNHLYPFSQMESVYRSQPPPPPFLPRIQAPSFHAKHERHPQRKKM